MSRQSDHCKVSLDDDVPEREGEPQCKALKLHPPLCVRNVLRRNNIGRGPQTRLLSELEDDSQLASNLEVT